MNCRKANNLLSAYLDGELAGVEHLQVREHLRICDCCRDEYESLLCTKRLLANLAVRMPRHQLEDRILQTLAVEREPVSSRLNWRTWWSLLTNPQRHRVRILALSSAFSFLAIALAVNPYLSSVRGGEASLPSIARSTSPVYVSPASAWPSIQKYRYLHDPWENAPTASVSITPASTSGIDAP